MKVNFDLNIANIINIGLGVALLITIFAKNSGMTKAEAKALYEHYYSQALQIGAKQTAQINARLDTFNLYQQRIDARDTLYMNNEKTLERLNRNIKRIENEIKNPKNYYVLPIDAADKFWSDRLNR